MAPVCQKQDFHARFGQQKTVVLDESFVKTSNKFLKNFIKPNFQRISSVFISFFFYYPKLSVFVAYFIQYICFSKRISAVYS
jgi:hypothetical protein